MPNTSVTRDPILLKLNFSLPKNRENDRPYGTTEYASKGDFVYRRIPHATKRYEYFRVPVSKVYLMTYWYDIPADFWELVDVYGNPVSLKLDSC
jgi:hypothetical protein